MSFLEPTVHPLAILSLWFLAICLLPFYSAPALAALAMLLLGCRSHRRWWRFIWRARWLLLTLWGILAYAMPGRAVADLPWLPTWEGVDEAGRQSVRLVLTLGCLAVLMQRLGREALVLAIWRALQPLAAWGVQVERLVVRLSLVLDYADHPVAKGAWRRLLHDEADPLAAVETLHLADLPWTGRDTGKLAFFCCLLLAGLLL